MWLFFQFFTGVISNKLNLRGLLGIRTRWQGRWPFLMLSAVVMWWLIMFDLASFRKPKSHCSHQGILWSHKKKIWKRLIRSFCLFTLGQHKVVPYYIFPQFFFSEWLKSEGFHCCPPQAVQQLLKLRHFSFCLFSVTWFHAVTLISNSFSFPKKLDSVLNPFLVFLVRHRTQMSGRDVMRSSRLSSAFFFSLPFSVEEAPASS